RILGGVARGKRGTAFRRSCGGRGFALLRRDGLGRRLYGRGLGGDRSRCFHRRHHRSGGRGFFHPLLERTDALVLIATDLGEIGLEALQRMAVLLRLAEDVGHLPLERIEALVERRDRRLGGGRLVGEAGGVGRAALREDLPLHLLDLPFETVEPLLRSWRRALGRGRRRRHERRCGERREGGDGRQDLH